MIPRKGKDIDGVEIDFLGGVHDLESPHERILVSYGRGKENFDLLVSAELYHNQGYNFTGIDKKVEERGMDYFNHYGNLMLKMSGDNYKVTFGYFNQEKSKFGILPIWSTNSETLYEGFYGEGVINGKVGERSNITSRIGYTSEDFPS